jgi:predicted phage terminase large subunit-like protein
VLVMQRLHQDDLAGYLLKQPGWFHLNLPAIATRDEQIPLGDGRFHQRKLGDVLHPARRSRKDLDAIKAMGSMIFAAQYQQSPVSEAGNLVQADWFQWYDHEKPPVRSATGRFIQSWDPALKGDPGSSFSVCTTWLQQDGNHYLRDVTRVQYVYPDLLDEVLKQYRRYMPDALLIEDNVSGSALIPDLRYRHQIHAIGIRPEGDKITRLGSASLSIQSGSVYLPREAPWLGNFLSEVLQFPQAEGGADDQVDSLSQYLNWAKKTGRETLFKVDWMYDVDPDPPPY